MAVVTKAHVGAGAAVDAVDALPAEQAVAPGIAFDQVVVAIHRFDRANVVDLRRAEELDAGGRHIQRQEAAIALQHTRDVDTEHRTTTTGAWHRVQAAGRRRQVLVDHTVVAEDDVVAVVATQGIAARHQRIAHRRTNDMGTEVVRHDQQRACDRIDDEAGVTVDVVVALLAPDAVVARAAGQMVSQLAAVDGVVARTAVDRDADARGADHVGRIEGAGIDDVVASEVERVGQAEPEGVACGADRVIDLGPEDRHVGPVLGKRAAGARRITRVPQAVLRGVAVDYQRRTRATTAEHGDGVTTDRAVGLGQVTATLHQRDRAMARRAGQRGRRRRFRRCAQGAGDGQLVVAAAHHQVEHFDGAHNAVSAEVAVRVDADAAETDTARNEGRLAVAGGGKAQAVGHLEAGQPGRAEHPDLVHLARIVVDIEHVNLVDLGRLGPDSDQRGVLLTGQHKGRGQAAINAADTALDGERALQGRQQVRLRGEGLHVGRWLLTGAEREPGDLDFLLEVPVGGREGQCAGCRGGLAVGRDGDGHVAQRR